MNVQRIAIACSLSLAGIAGCASDPGKQANTAETELTAEQQKARTEEQDKNAEAIRKQEAARAEAASDKTVAISDEKKDVDVSQANLDQDRRDFDAKAKERLAKVDAKAKELKTKSTKLTGKKAADFKTHHTAFTTERNSTNTKIGNLGSTSNDSWGMTKNDIEKHLDTLENMVSSMEKDL